MLRFRSLLIIIRILSSCLTPPLYPFLFSPHLSQTLATDEHSNVLIYMNGHGGDQFLKFHDMEEVSSHDIGGALREMELKKRYHRVGAHACSSFSRVI